MRVRIEINLIKAKCCLFLFQIKMLPTPAKFHYIFNLRDLSRIWEGMLTVKGNECQNKRTLLGLWKHECTRVIADRYYTFRSIAHLK